MRRNEGIDALRMCSMFMVVLVGIVIGKAVLIYIACSLADMIRLFLFKKLKLVEIGKKSKHIFWVNIWDTGKYEGYMVDSNKEHGEEKAIHSTKLSVS